MKTSATARAFVTTIAATSFLWLLMLSASPQLHAQVHSDANQVEHTCAVTFVTSGNCTHCPPVGVISPPVPPSEFSKIRVLTFLSAPPLIMAAHIFAHAPPQYS
jgi:hypothetical protein